MSWSTQKKIIYSQSEEKFNKVEFQMQFECGRGHTVCLDHEGGFLWGFGQNEFGQLGIEDKEAIVIPEKIPLLANIISVSCARDHTVCADTNGFVWSFGLNDHGQLGIGNKENQKKPQRIQMLSKIVYISTGGYHTLCINSEGEMWAFGRNNEGQLGINSTTEQTKPVKVTKVKNIKTASSGGYHSYIIDKEDNVYCFGFNQWGQLGLGDNVSRIEPTKFTGVQDILKISCGWCFTLVQTNKGQIYTWGYNEHGELGLGDTENRNKPNRVILPNIQNSATGHNHSFCIDYDGVLRTFGFYKKGRLGVPEQFDQVLPQIVKFDEKITFISQGGNHTIVGDITGKVFGFGSNYYGQLGIGEACDEVISPTKLVSEFTASLNHSITFNWEIQQKLNNFSKEEIEKLKSIERSVRDAFLIPLAKDYKTMKKNLSLNCKPKSNWNSWKEISNFLHSLLSQDLSNTQEQSIIHKSKAEEIVKRIEQLQEELVRLQEELIQIQNTTKEISIEETKNINPIQYLSKLITICSKKETEFTNEFVKICSKGLFDVHGKDIEIILWKMGLSKYYKVFQGSNIEYEYFATADQTLLIEIGLSQIDSCRFLYYRDLILKTNNIEPCGCVVCDHNTPKSTCFLLTEYEINLNHDIIIKNDWTAPFLLYLRNFTDEFSLTPTEAFNVRKTLQAWIDLHNNGLNEAANTQQNKN